MRNMKSEMAELIRFSGLYYVFTESLKENQEVKREIFETIFANKWDIQIKDLTEESKKEFLYDFLSLKSAEDKDKIKKIFRGFQNGEQFFTKEDIDKLAKAGNAEMACLTWMLFETSAHLEELLQLRVKDIRRNG